MEAETHYADSGGVSIAYQVHGDGPVDLVLVPGFVSHVELLGEEPGVARFFRRLGATAYGFGLFSHRLSAEDYGRMFHSDDERVDVESLRLSTEMWEAVAVDLLGGAGSLS